MTGLVGTATAGSLFLAGLLGSLHCLAMCGPIILAFEGWSRGGSRRSDSADGQGLGGDQSDSRLERIILQLAYHAGRVWTYALLGFGAGWVGAQARLAASSIGTARLWVPLGLGLGVLLLAAAVLLSRREAGWATKAPGACLGVIGRSRGLSALLRRRSVSARFVLGLGLGFLPCGLVYAALVVSATLPPLSSALAMAAFGVGTIPALASLALGIGLVPLRWRRQPPRVAVWLLVLAGVVVLFRAVSSV